MSNKEVNLDAIAREVFAVARRAKQTGQESLRIELVAALCMLEDEYVLAPKALYQQWLDGASAEPKAKLRGKRMKLPYAGNCRECEAAIVAGDEAILVQGKFYCGGCADG